MDRSDERRRIMTRRTRRNNQHPFSPSTRMKIPQLFVGILVLFLAAASLATAQRTGIPECPLCRSLEREIVNPGHGFTMRDRRGNTASWTCGGLEEAMMDVAPTDFICVLSQTWAERECECSGPPIAPLGGQVVDPNPSCNLCRDDRVVPAVNQDELVETGVAGRMPCGGLYNALAEGILPVSYCSVVQDNAADFCCEIPIINLSDIPDPVEETCGKVYEKCTGGDGCCPGLQCKTRAIGQDPICSPVPRSVGRQSLAASRGVGGAAGAFKGSG